METAIAVSPSRRGTMADYRSGKTYKKVFTFVLNHQVSTGSITNERTKQLVKFPPSKIIPLIDSVPNKNGNGLQIIRYVTGEETIIRSEQQGEDKNYKEYAEFVKGVKQIPGEDKALLEYFMTCNANGSNFNRDENEKIIFYLVDGAEGMKAAIQKSKDIASLQAWSFTAPWADVHAYAISLGMSEDLESDEIRYNLSLMAEKDPVSFEKGKTSPFNKRKYYAVKAARAGILVVDQPLRTVSWSNGVNPISISAPNVDPIDHFVETTFSVEGEKIWATLEDRMKPSEAKAELTETQIPEQPKEPLLQSTSIGYEEADELFNKGLEMGVITKPAINSFGFDGVSVIGKSNFMTKMREDQPFLDKLKEAVK